MASFYIPLSGLNSDSKALNTIANNLSNMNTTAYKSQTTNFSDLFYQQVGTAGSGDEIQVGGGVKVASNSVDYTQGSFNTSGTTASDVALNGNGFFLVNDGGTNLLTRNGTFTQDSSGQLITSDGLNVMGYAAVNGVVNTAAPLAPISIPVIGQVQQPQATTSFGMTATLDSSAAVGDSVNGQVQVYDSLGNNYEATVTYTKTATNQWSYSVSLPDSLKAAPATPAAASSISLTADAPAATIVTASASEDTLGTTIPSSVSATSPLLGAASVPLTPAAPVAAVSTNPAVTIVSDTTTTPGTTADTYSFAAMGLLDTGTNLGITVAGTTYSATPSANEKVSDYAAALNASLPAGSGVTVTGNDVTQKMTITGATGSFTTLGAVKQDVAQTATNFNFVSSNGQQATVDPTTTLNISEGGLGPVTAPAFTSSQSVSSYAQALTGALTSAGITDVTVTANNGQLSITGPGNMSITGKMKQDFTGTVTNYDFGTYTDPNTGLSVQSTVAPATSLTISAPTTTGGSTTVTIAPSNPAGESVAQYATDVQNALAANNITGVSVSAANGVLSILGPDNMTIAGSVSQNMLGTTSNYAFESKATVDPATNLTIGGQTGNGTAATITAPAVAAGETVAQYAAALTSALAAAKIANVTVSATNGQLSIAGANMTLNGAVKQGLADTAINYDFGPSATVNLATSITIVGPTVSGAPPTAITMPPAITAGETVAQYAAALNNELTKAGINTGPDGVSVTANGGQLSIVGPAATLKTAGTAVQDLMATTINYNFGSGGGQVATVDPGSTLTISGLTTSGATATTVAPAITSGTTLASYATALTNALAAAGITGTTVSATAAGQLSITGANITTSGTLVQDPVASAAAAGALTFNSSGNLVSPATNVGGISFAGLSDGAAPLTMAWNVLGASGTPTISQVATGATSSTSAGTQNGYAGGAYKGFSIGGDGIVTASYSNGQTQAVGQLALANVTNLEGLSLQGNGDYATTLASGAASIGVSGTNGLAGIQDSSLEMSNVNISAEFSNLIIAQRGFEANSKAITTFDTITQETINMIH